MIMNLCNGCMSQAHRGYRKAQLRLAYMLSKGEFVAKNETEAVRWLKRAEENIKLLNSQTQASKIMMKKVILGLIAFSLLTGIGLYRLDKLNSIPIDPVTFHGLTRLRFMHLVL